MSLEREFQLQQEVKSLRQQLAEYEKQVKLLRDAFMPLTIHRHTTNDAEYRAAEKALATTEPK